MFSNLSPGVVGIRGLTLDQTIDLAKRHGFGGIDAPLEEISKLPAPEEAAKKMKQAGLLWGGFGLPIEFRKDDATYATGMQALERLAPVAQRIGCTRCYTWIMPGHAELDYQANFQQHVQRLKPAVAIMARHGIRFGVEFVGPKTLRDRFKHAFIYRIDQALELADAIAADGSKGAASTGVLLDCFHWYTSGATAADIVSKLPNARIVYVHVNDAKPGRTPQEQVDGERALPGDTGVIDLKGFMGALRRVGYDGPVAAEPFMKELGESPVEQTAARVAAAMQKTLAA